LDDYVAKLPVLTRIIRSPKRIGLIKARLMGARQAKGKILVFLDAHCECTLGNPFKCRGHYFWLWSINMLIDFFRMAGSPRESSGRRPETRSVSRD